MDAVLAARTQMALSLAFHMIFASVGMAMPLMMLVAEARWLRAGDAEALALARTWAKVTAVLFAIGAVSGTALSFELGLLWPRFMAMAGPLIGPAFALEGYAFFIEAIFLGLYLYGWDRLSPRAHWLCGWPVALGGAASGVVVLATVSWMQSPAGFALGPGGELVDHDPVAAVLNPAFALMAAHSTLSTYQAVGLATAGVYAVSLLRGRRPERAGRARLAIAISMAVALGPALAQPLLGHALGSRAHREQPAKLAAMEGQFATERGAPLRIGGWPDPEAGRTRWALEIPSGLSLLAAGDLDAEVLGLEAFPADERPPVQVVHPAFQAMVGAGGAMVALAAWFWLALALDRRRGLDWTRRRRLLTAIALATPLGFVALYAGWIVTEVGRQPWIVYGILRVSDAVTPAPGVPVSMAGFMALYAGLLLSLALLLRRIGRDEAREAGDADPADEGGAGHGPR